MKKPYKQKVTAKEELPSLDKRTSFFEDVWAVTCQIPFGRVTSYGAIAAYLGARSSSRMVGWALNGVHRYHEEVPAHRVVNRNGMLSGKAHFSPPEKMQELLESEGIHVENDTVVNFEELFWDPSENMTL